MSEHNTHHQNKSDLAAILEPYFAKLPALPKNAQETLANIMQWIALIFGLLGLITAISGLGLLGATSPLAFLGGMEGVSAYGSGMIAALFSLAAAVLLLAAYPGLKAKQYKGWTLLFWSEIVSIVGAVISISGLLGGLIWGAVGLYILYQIKHYFK